MEKIQWEDDDAKEFCESYEKNGYDDYRLITRAEALAILGNAELVAQLGLHVGTDYGYWTTEEYSEEAAYEYTENQTIEISVKTSQLYVLPIRKVNFYGLPLIESEFGGGLVYDVVAETRTVHIVAKWSFVEATLGSFSFETWNYLMALFPLTLENTFTSMPTRAQALKIFGNSYLVTLAGLPVDRYWTSEEDQEANAWAYWNTTNTIESTGKTEPHYALPVRSEVVPEA